MPWLCWLRIAATAALNTLSHLPQKWVFFNFPKKVSELQSLKVNQSNKFFRCLYKFQFRWILISFVSSRPKVSTLMKPNRMNPLQFRANEQKVGTINQTSHFSSSTFNSKFFNLRRLNYYVSSKVSNQISFHEIFEELNLDDEKPKRHKWTKKTQSCWQHLIYTSLHLLAVLVTSDNNNSHTC